MKSFDQLLKLNARDQIIETHKVALPISGGRGNSKEDAIIFEKISYDRGIDLEYQILHAILDIAEIVWRLEQTEVFTDNTRKFERLKLVFEGDEEHYRNFYFDVTNFIYPE